MPLFLGLHILKMINLDTTVTTDKQWKLSLDGKAFSVVYIRTEALAERAVKKLLASEATVLGFDIETGKKKDYIGDPVAGLCPYRSFPSLLQFYDSTTSTCYLFDTLLLSRDRLVPILSEKRLVAHNAIFDLQHIKHAYGVAPKIDCSMIMYNMVRCAEFSSIEEEENYIEEEWDGEEGDGTALNWLAKYERHGASLRTVTAKLLGIRVEKELQLSNWTDRPLSARQLVYAANDARFTFEIGRILSNKLIDFKMQEVYALNRNAMHPVTDMILNGCEIDREAHAKDIKLWAKQKDALHVQVLKIFGKDANIRSTHQISNWLEKNLPTKYQHQWARSEKTGKLKSDAKTLSKFAHLPFVAPLLSYKKLDKLLSTYGQSLLDKICPVTKRLHGSFTLGYTATGRLSSRSPNLQNLPRDTDIRGIFRAANGHLLLGADYSQIELRAAGMLSGDKTMLKAYEQGLDLHTYLASRISGRPMDRVTKEQRQLSKAINFGLLFGLGAKGLVEYAQWNYGVTLTIDEAYNHVRTFFDTYSGYSAWQQTKRDEAALTQQIATKLGKVRRLTDKRVFTCSVNHPVQGSAAEVVITALNMLHKPLRAANIKVINCIHDEILLECPKNKQAEGTAILRTCMEKAMLKVFPGASLNKLVEVKSGLTWADTKG